MSSNKNLTIQYIIKLFKTYLFLVLSFTLSNMVWGQDLILLNKLEDKLKLGNKNYLLELGKYINEDKGAKEILQKYCIFNNEDTIFTSSLNFQNFIYQNERKLYFSNILDKFLVSPLAKIEHNLVARDNVFTYDDKKQEVFLALKNNFSTDKKQSSYQLNKIASLNWAPSIPFLIQVLKKSKKHDFLEEHLSKTIAIIGRYADLKVLNQILDWNNSMIDLDIKSELLQEITLIKKKKIESSLKYIKRCQKVIYNSKDLATIKIKSYEKNLTYKQFFFYTSTDFFGKMLLDRNISMDKKERIIYDLIATQSPLSLFYLSAYIYKYKDKIKTTDLLSIQEKINLSTQVLLVKKNNKQLNYSNVMDLENQMFYWASNYKKYKWSRREGHYVHKNYSNNMNAYYAKNFKLLTSKNDSIAHFNYLELTKAPPKEIRKLSFKYSMILKEKNNSLPSFSFNYLEVLSELNKYCYQTKIPTELSDNSLNLFYQLLNNQSVKTRFELEEKLVNTLSLKEITAFEIICLSYAKDTEFQKSASKIMDWFYSENWNRIWKSQEYLRLYLKKSALFTQIGDKGTCSQYLNKFNNLSSYQTNALFNLLNYEIDSDISNQIKTIFYLDDKQKIINANLQSFLQNPQSFDSQEISILPKPKEKDLLEIFQLLRSEKQNSTQIFEYLGANFSFQFTPFLIQIVAENLTQSSKAKYLLLSHLPFNEDESPEKWLKIWNKQGKKPKKLVIKLINNQIKKLEQQTSIPFNSINNLLKNKYIQKHQLQNCLTLIHKIKNKNRIGSLNFYDLSVDRNLKFFLDFEMTPNTLLNVIKFFKDEKPDVKFDFISSKISKFDNFQKANVINGLFEQVWFVKYVDSKNFSDANNLYIKKILAEYVFGVNLISEFEEERTLINISHLQYKNITLAEKLEKTLQLETINRIKSKIQYDLVAPINFEEIHLILPYINALTDSEEAQPSLFLVHDFGFPLFNLDQKDITKLIPLFRSKTNGEIHKILLKSAGIDIFIGEKLDLNKISKVLLFDNSTPFTGSPITTNNNYTFSIIKVLEERFGTNLGFHPKLNQNQTFFKFNTISRSFAWLDYLSDRGLIDIKDYAPSFNYIQKK